MLIIMKRPEFQIDISSIQNKDRERIRKGVEDIRKKNPNLTYTEARCEYFYLEHEKTKTHHISTENHVNEIGLQEASKRDTKHYK